MPLIINIKLIPITETMSAFDKTTAEIANNTVNLLAETMRNSPASKLDPLDGRKAIYTFTADMEKTVIIDKELTFS